jgi:hypothetical protein
MFPTSIYISISIGIIIRINISARNSKRGVQEAGENNEGILENILTFKF